MQSDSLIIFFLSLAVMIITALLFGQIMRRLGQPPVLGELLGGILLGPSVFGSLAPGIFQKLFPMSGPAFIGREAIIYLGLMFFLFVAGLEIRLGELKSQGRAILMTSFMGMAVPFVLGVWAVLGFRGLWSAQAQAPDLGFAVFMGTALAISALPVIVKILTDLNLLRTPFGGLVVSSATLNDLAGWLLFAVLLARFVHGTGNPWVTIVLVIAVFVLVLTWGRRLGRHLIPLLEKWCPGPSGFIAVTAAFVLLAAAFMEAVKIHAIFGAFLVGVALTPDDEHRKDTQEIIYQFVTGFFAAPVYFVSIGLRVNFIANFDFYLVTFVLTVACLGKILGASVGARLSGVPFKKSLALGFALNARGAMEVILAGIALEYGIVHESIFVALVVTALITSMIAGPAIRLFLSGDNATMGQDFNCKLTAGYL
ncbi:MAG: cation:proton antiporter [Candidatus Omnitrophica bacterium]|nr:cation:proton antiporter [Candidatus Omnitrophota bacterium]